ncbi:hypothetical protein [Dryocola sp. BD613]|uniref:hypothetical protein n=1 Tax=Dryocola sp. BD613 TaxID=3133272 RepID=UPI003F504E53
MTTNKLKNNNLYFYLYMAAPLVLPNAYYFTMNDKAAFAAFAVVALICIGLDL